MAYKPITKFNWINQILWHFLQLAPTQDYSFIHLIRPSNINHSRNEAIKHEWLLMVYYALIIYYYMIINEAISTFNSTVGYIQPRRPSHQLEQLSNRSEKSGKIQKRNWWWDFTDDQQIYEY